jgi:hypothetical protein
MSKANDWTIAPAFSDLAHQGDDQPHTVSWNFPTKQVAAQFAVFVESIHGRCADDASNGKLLTTMTEASIRLAIALGNARTMLKAVAADVPTLQPLIVLALEKCDPGKVNL